MKIKIVEYTHSSSVTKPHTATMLERKATGREWEIDIPIEPITFRRVWLEMKGDVRELIQLAKNSLRR